MSPDGLLHLQLGDVFLILLHLLFVVCKCSDMFVSVLLDCGLSSSAKSACFSFTKESDKVASHHSDKYA